MLNSFAGLLATKSAFYYLAWYAVFRLLAGSDPARRSSASDLLVALCITLVNFLPARSAAWMAATAAGLYLWSASSSDGKLNGAATVLLALALNGFWGRQIFDIFAYWIVRADAAIVGSLLSAFEGEVTWQETIIGGPDGRGLIVYGPCSSFHNISLGLLCWVTMTKLARTEWVRGDVLIGLLVCTTVISLNTWRLSILVLRPDDFTYWHLGFGADLFNWATSLAVLAISLWGALRAPRLT